MNGNKPFIYDFDDFTGKDDYRKVTVTKLLETHTGQCRSLPLLYKLVADEIGTESYLAAAPNHLYIKHLDENNKWVNVELTNSSLSSDAYIMSSLGISVEAIKNGVYMEAMDSTQSIALLLDDLSEAYIHKYGYTDFGILCTNKALEYYPNFMKALLGKHNLLLEIAKAYRNETGIMKDDFLIAYNDSIGANHKRIEQYGFREIPKDEYEKWVKQVEDEKAKRLSSNIK